MQFVKVEAQASGSIGLDTQGNAWSWGLNLKGRLGQPVNWGKYKTPTRIQMPAGVTITDLSAGGHHALAIGSDGKTYAWGYFENGRLGAGVATAPTYTPAPVSVPDGVTFVDVEAGGDHS